MTATEATLRADRLALVEELTTLAPELGWPEATELADAVVEALAHRVLDLDVEPEAIHVVPVLDAAGRRGGSGDAPVGTEHASCRAAAARLRELAPRLDRAVERYTVPGPGRAWAPALGTTARELADLLDRAAERARTGQVGSSAKAVVLRRLHGLLRGLR